MPSYTPRSSRHPYSDEDDKELWGFYIKEFRRLRFCSSNKMWEDFLAQHGKKRLVWSFRRASGIESHFRKVLVPKVVDSPLRGKDLYDVMKFYQTKLDKNDIKFLEKREPVKVFTDDHGCFLKAVDAKTNEVINEETFDRSRKGSFESESSAETVDNRIGRRFLESDRDSSYDGTSVSSTDEVEYNPSSPKKQPTSPRRLTRSQHNAEVAPTHTRELRSRGISPRTVRTPSVEVLEDQIDTPTSSANSTRITRSQRRPEVSSPTKRRLDAAKEANNNGNIKISPSKPTATGSPKKKLKADIADPPVFEEWNETLKQNVKAILNGKLEITDLERNVEIPEQYQKYFDMPVAKAFLRLALKGPRDPEAIPMNLLYKEPVNSN